MQISKNFLLPFVTLIICNSAFATPSDNPDVLARRGIGTQSKNSIAPSVTLSKPESGWTTAMQLEVAGTCSDTAADPITVAINGTRYFARNKEGQFAKRFPASPGKNDIIVSCSNKGGTAQATAQVHAAISDIPLKVVLTNDTDGAYTDLHIYEPDGTHVYWASTNSPSGGIFFLNNQGDSFDDPGFGPYLYVHPAPPTGVFRIDTNYWPGGASRHTLANLDLIMNEGTTSEQHRTVQRPLARPDETQTLAYLVVKGGKAPVQVWVPGQDSEASMPLEVATYQKEIEPKIKNNKTAEGDEALLIPQDERLTRTNVVNLALQQAKAFSPRWNSDQRDCAGLVRFSYREALRPYSDFQHKQLGIPTLLSFPSVSPRAYMVIKDYPRLWDTRIDRAEHSEFADAETLIGLNFKMIGRELSAAIPGDLLVFRRQHEATVPYHLMIVADVRRGGLAVYHNGAEGSDGQVRVVRFDSINESPDATWIPSFDNPSFLGVFRWKRFNPAAIAQELQS